MRAQVEIGTGGGKRTVGLIRPESLAPKVAEMGRGDAELCGDGVWGCCSPLDGLSFTYVIMV